MDFLDWVLHQQEGQFFERKSCFDRLKGKLRSVREVARDVAETLAAIANADGGAFVLGVEDDSTLFGEGDPDGKKRGWIIWHRVAVRPRIGGVYD